MDVNISRIYDGSIKGKYTLIRGKLLNGGQDEAQGLIVVTRGSTEACQKEVMSPELRVKNCEQCVQHVSKGSYRG